MPHIYFAERSKRSTSLNVFCVKITSFAPKILYLDTYRIYSSALPYKHSVKGDNHYLERTGKIASSVLNLSSSYVYPYLLSEFSRIG